MNIVDKDGNLEITVSGITEYKSDLDVNYKIDIRDLIFEYPEADYYIQKIGAINAEIYSEKLICDAF